MTWPFEAIKPFTSWVDVKDRLWMVIDIDYWGLHESRQETPQRIFLQRVGSSEDINITAASMVEEIEKNNMRQVNTPVVHKFKQ